MDSVVLTETFSSKSRKRVVMGTHKRKFIAMSLLPMLLLFSYCGKVSGKEDQAKESNTAGLNNPNSPEGSTPGAPPSYVSHNRINPSLIEVSLTKELTDATGTNTSNFIFNNGLQAVSIAKKSGEPTTLQITTTTQQQFFYTLTMLNLTTTEGIDLTGVIQITFEGLPSPAVTSIAWKDPSNTAVSLPVTAYGISLCQLASGSGSVCTTAPFYNRTSLYGILTGADAVAYSYKIDAGAWSAEIPIATPLAPTGLADGYHTIYIIGKHTNGYWQSTSASDVYTLSYVQDSTPPDAYIDALTYPASVTASTTFNVRVIGTDVSYFLYCLDNSATTDCTSANWQGLTAAASASSGYGLPIGTYPSNLQPGAVNIRVRGIDASGNAQATPIAGGQYSWVVDTGTVEAVFNATDITAITTTGTSVSVRVSNSAGAVSYKGKVVSGTDCNSGTGWDTLSEVTNLSTPITATGLAANGGYYTVCAIGKSLGNNWQGGWSGTSTASVVTKYSWIVDTTAPTASITWLNSPYAYPGSTPAITVTDYQWQVSTSDGVTHYRYAIVTGAGSTCSGATFGAETTVATPILFTAASTGVNTYKLCVIARDAAGNYQATASASTEGEWTVDKDPPANNPSFSAVSQAARVFSVPVIQFDIDNSTAPADAYYYKIEVAKDTGFTQSVSTITVESCKTETSLNCPATLATKTVSITVDSFTQGSVYARIQAGDKLSNYRTDYSATSAEHYVVGKITGTVKNTAATALSGISVRMQETDGSSLSAIYADQTTDGTGKFTFSNVRTAKNRYRVVAALSDATYRPAMKQKLSVRDEGSGGTVQTNVGNMVVVALSATNTQNIVAKVVDADDGWMLGYAEVKLVDYQGNTVGTVQRTVSTNAAYTDCDSTPPVGGPPTNIPKQIFSGGGICGDVTFANITPGTYSLQVTGASWASGQQTYNDLLQENVVVTGPEESRYLIPRAGGATASSIYSPVGHSMRSGPTVSAGAAISDGTHAFPITTGPFTGKWLLVRGNNSNVTRIFNPIDNASSLAGPTLSANARFGAHSFDIPSGTHAGKRLIIHGNALTSTSMYDPATHTIVAGPALSAAASNGALSFSIPSGANAGKVIVVHANGATTTSLYDPATHLFTAGPALPAAANIGAFSLTIDSGTQSGKVRVILGGTTNNTAVYDPALNTFAAGSTLSANAAAGANAFRISSGTNSGKDLVIHGGAATTTSLYDPATDSFGIGPALSAVAGAGSSSLAIDSGAQIGKKLVVLGNSSNATSLYDTATNTFSAGPTLPGGAVGAGSFALKLNSLTQGRLPLVRSLVGQDLKVVLSWGSGDPYDLDLHVVGTLPTGQTLTNVNNDNCGTANDTLFHTWAARPSVGMSWAQQYSAKTRTYIQGDSAYNGSGYFPTNPDTTTALVQDAIAGFGPEAINFIGGYTDGTYWFSVANWSQWFSGSYAGADKFNQQWDVTNVEIKVYDSTGLAFQMVAADPTATPDFTESPSASGCSSTTDWQQCELWRAFKMTVSGTGPSSRTFTPVNGYANWPDSSGTQDQSKCKMGGNW
jgi:hypothetical protein